MGKPILDDERRRELPPHEETNPLMGDEGGAGDSKFGRPSCPSNRDPHRLPERRDWPWNRQSPSKKVAS